MHELSNRLLYYKQREIQQAIVDSARDREVGIKYAERGFGKRPDVLMYANDILDSVKKGASSFHVSEERWRNPMQLSAGMRKKELDELRKGWDLVLDIDCPYWRYSKLSAHLFVKALMNHGLVSISCKFSGNKGFHIAVPFEAFPKEVNNILVEKHFPEGPKEITLYLLDYISNNLIDVSETGGIIFDKKYKTTIEKIAKLTGKDQSELSKFVCPDCSKEVTNFSSSVKKEFICPKCETRIVKEDETKILVCPKCNVLMEKKEYKLKNCACGSEKPPKRMFDPLSIIDVDTLLISSRHMYRAPYSMHEKSRLVSLPINPEKVMQFEKKQANPKKVQVNKTFVFLDGSRCEPDEAQELMINAFDFRKEEILFRDSFADKKTHKEKEYELPETAIPEEYFPPSIKKGLQGLEDGRKRFLFILINFLSTLGWTHAKIEEIVWKWNEKNPEPLKENYIIGQLRYAKTNKEKVPPPNYVTGIYKDLQIEDPENITSRYNNPVTYAKVLYSQKNKEKKKRKKLTKKQKEMRKKHRQKLKKQKASKKDNENTQRK